jgi:putative ABC transport system permease protein
MKFLHIKKSHAANSGKTEPSSSTVSSSDKPLEPLKADEASPVAPLNAKPTSSAAPLPQGNGISLVLSHIKKDYYIDGKPFTALQDISLAFPTRGFVAILGPSGCGKTTMLNIIGGLDHYTSGDLLIDGKSTKDFKDSEWDGYRNERVGFVFQSYNLIPHENVLQNVEVSLLLNGVSKKEQHERALAALDKVGLKDSALKRPNQLSGGQMQRVALARAVVNNPKIILADEPTGALDSGTSIQVMDILKGIASDRLVIMVTHNRDLADQYADRIIEMKDGVILSDSAPLALDNVVSTGKEITKKTAMSFPTALHSSFLSIGTKKGRTILTAVASSIGIIGVALVLAVSNGFQGYVDNVEGSVASSVPITVTPVDYSYLPVDETKAVEYPSDPNLYVYDTSTNSYVIHRNNYDQEYFDYVSAAVDKKLARSVMFNRQSFSFNLLTKDGMGDAVDSYGNPAYRKINQYNSASMSASVVSSVTSLPATIFHELYGEEQGISSMYDVIYGSYPKNEDEIVLITDRYNRVEFSTLQQLGIINSSATVETGQKIAFSDIVYDGSSDTDYKEYKAYYNSYFYKMFDADGNDLMQTETRPAWEITKFDPSTAKFVGKETTKDIHFYANHDNNVYGYYKIFNDDAQYHPISLKIVGVLRPSKDSYVSLMPSSIGYLSALKDDLYKDVASGGRGEKLAQIAPENYYINRGTDDMRDRGKLTTGWPDGLDSLNAAINKIVYVDSGKLAIKTDVTLSESLLENILTSAYLFRYPDISDPKNNYPGFITSGGTFLYANRNFGGDFKEAAVVMPATPTTAYDPNDEDWVRFTSFWTNKLNDPEFYNGTDPKWSAIDFEAYFNSYALVSSILIFPISLTKKDELHSYLDAYNTGKTDADSIVYTDIMATFTSSLSVLIQIISVVLLIFAAISLVVSSVMTGIITYVSVVERTKEIGILRACGARKKDIGRLFEAECTIIGFAAGLIGVGFTYLVCIPINLIIDHLYPGNNLSSIASLNPIHALILLALGVVLALISGLIPSRMAAKKDPVVALRTE